MANFSFIQQIKILTLSWAWVGSACGEGRWSVQWDSQGGSLSVAHNGLSRYGNMESNCESQFVTMREHCESSERAMRARCVSTGQSPMDTEEYSKHSELFGSIGLTLRVSMGWRAVSCTELVEVQFLTLRTNFIQRPKRVQSLDLSTAVWPWSHCPRLSLCVCSGHNGDRWR